VSDLCVSGLVGWVLENCINGYGFLQAAKDSKAACEGRDSFYGNPNVPQGEIAMVRYYPNEKTI
jgi:hypothetical protein